MSSDSPAAYIETSVVSYLTALPSGNLLAAAWQKATADWWRMHKNGFRLVTSSLTLEEAGRGDPDAARRRLATLSSIPLLPITEAAVELAGDLLRERALPATAQNDAIHAAVAAVHGIDFLLTWNFRHLANAETRPVVRSVCRRNGYTSPEICTPSELMGDIEDG